MKIKVGPFEVEDDALNDEVLFKEYKEDSKKVKEYLSERSKYLDSTLNNAITGDSVKTLGIYLFIAIFSICYSIWTIKMLQMSGPFFNELKEIYGTIPAFAWTTIIFLILIFIPVGLVLLLIAIIVPKKTAINKTNEDKRNSDTNPTEADSHKN